MKKIFMMILILWVIMSLNGFGGANGNAPKKEKVSSDVERDVERDVVCRAGRCWLC